MSTERALVIVAVLLFAALALTWMGLRIWQANQTVTAALDDDGWVYDGPDSLRLLEDLDRDLDEHLGRLAPLFEQLGPLTSDQQREEET